MAARVVVMMRLGTEEASHHYPASGTRLEADPVLVELAEWRLQVTCWRPKPVKWKSVGTQTGNRIKESAQRWPASGGLPAAHFTAHLYATQWVRVGWLPWGAAVLQWPGGRLLVLCLQALTRTYKVRAFHPDNLGPV